VLSHGFQARDNTFSFPLISTARSLVSTHIDIRYKSAYAQSHAGGYILLHMFVSSSSFILKINGFKSKFKP
jgi:hypothetical protein